MILQLNIASLSLRTLGLHPPFMSSDAVHDEEHEVDNPIATHQYPPTPTSLLGYNHLQYESQEHIGRDLNLAHGVDIRLTHLRPEVELVARDDAVEIEPHGLPPPEPAVADGEDNAGHGERPDEEVAADVPGWVVGTAAAVADE